MRIDRLFGILYLLLERKRVTAKALAGHFGVSERTILRDIDTLSAARIPVYAAQGRGGGFSLLDGYTLNKAALSEEEQTQILMALQSAAAAGNPGAAETRGKLAALFQKSGADWIEVDFSRWGTGGLDNRRFQLLKAAILERCALGFDYVAANGAQGARTVYPLKLAFKSKAWYLQGFCTDRQDYRTFKVNRILNLRATDERFSAGRYDPPPLEAATPPPSALVDLLLLLPAHAAWRAYDEFDEGCIEKTPDGSYRVFVRLPEDDWLHAFLLSFGGDAEVLSPPRLAEKYNKT